MKKYIIILSILSIVTSCNKEFMDRYPLDKINDANYWKSVSDLKTYANQFYPVMSRINAYQTDNNSDNQAPASINSFTWNEYVVPSSGGGWAKSDWSGVRSCNYFLQRYQGVQGNVQEINQYVAEIRFFKAFYYFEKLRLFHQFYYLYN